MKVKDQCHNTTTTNDKVNAEKLLSLQQEQQHHDTKAKVVDVDGDNSATVTELREDQQNNESIDSCSGSLAETCGKTICHINMLPDEMLEFILTYLPPYMDLENCSLVCKRWHDIVKSKYTKDAVERAN